MNKKQALTLVELIIAVLIIGIVATLAISTYFASTESNNQKYVTALRKVYTGLSYATDRTMETNGGTLIGAFSDSDSIVTEYCTYLKCAKTCASGAAVSDGCFNAQADIKMLDNATYTINPTTAAYRSFILSDGSYVLTNFISGNCATTEDNVASCGWLYIDVNGSKAPNIVGRDIYKILITEDKIYPSGSLSTDTNFETCTTSDSGIGCTAKILEEGVMTY